MRKAIFYLLAGFLVCCGSFWLVLHSEAFWRWTGHTLIKVANERLQGKLSVEEIGGTPFSGYVWQGLRLTSAEGEVFRAKGLMLRVSLGSILRLAPVMDTLALYEPVLTLAQNKGGQWNVCGLTPPPEKGQTSGMPLTLRSLSLSQLKIENGTILVQQPGGSQRFDDLDVDLNLKILQPLSPQRRLEVGTSRLAATTPWGRYVLKTELGYGDNQVEMTSLILDSDSHRLLSLAGKLSLDSDGNSHLTGNIGPVPPSFITRFYDPWPSTWKVASTLEVQGGLGDLQVSLGGTVHEASFQLAVRLALAREPSGYDLTVKMTGVSPEMLSALNVPGGEVYCESSSLGVTLRLRGAGLAWPPPEFAWELRAEPFTFRKAKVDKLEIKAAGSADRQTLEGVVCSNLGGLGLKVQGSLFKAPQGEFKLLVEDFEPGPLGVRAGSETFLNADITGRFSLPDLKRLASLRISGAVQASGSLEGKPLNDLQGRFTWEQHRLTLERMRAEVGNVAAEVNGTLDGDRLAFSHRGKTLPGGNWPIPDTLKGGLTWNGTLEGTLSDPRYTLQAQGQGVAVGTVALDFFNLRAQGLGLPPCNGTLEVKAGGVKTPAGTFQQVTFNSAGEGMGWCYQLKASSPPPGPLVELAGSVDLGTQPRHLLVDRLNLSLAGISVRNQGQVQARFLPGLDLPTATFRVNGGTVQVAARLEGDQVSGRLEVRQLPLEIANMKGLKGFMQAQVTLSGSASSPGLDGTIHLAPLQWQQFSFQGLDTTLSYRGREMKLAGKTQEGPQGISLTWNGTIPLQLSLRPFQFNLPESGLDLGLRSTGANLKLLATLTPEIAKADVPVDLQVRVKGTWRQPEIEAHLRWQQGTMTLTQAGIPYTIAPGTMNWQGNKLSLPQLTLESGGTAILSGEVDFQGYQPRTVKARATVDNFKVLDRLASQALVNGEVNLNGPWTALVLRGRLFIPRATINPALIRSSSRQNPDIILVRRQKAEKAKQDPGAEAGPDFYRQMRIEVSVEAPNNVWIKQKTQQVKAEVELNVDVRVRKKPGEALALGGLVRSLEGNLDVFNKEFKVDKAMVTLPGVPNQQPVIEARASHEMTDAMLLVDVHGPVNKPQIDLSSSPPLPANDLMSYLLFGRPVGDLSQQEFDAKQQAVGVLGGMTASKIQEILGNDFPILGDINVKSSAGSIGLTKNLAKGVSISVERRTSPTAREDPTVVRLQYRLNRYLRLQAEQGQRNTGGDVLFKYDF